MPTPSVGSGLIVNCAPPSSAPAGVPLLPGDRARRNRHDVAIVIKLKAAAVAGAAVAGAADRADVTDDVGIHRHRASLRKALPFRMVAVVLRVMLASARIFPSNAVPVPSVAELPTCQNTPSSEPPLEPRLIT